jgi:hypothetical protein
MTFSVPSFLAAATREFIPPPAEAEVTVAQLVPPLELDEPPEEHPAPSNARAATPAIANRYDALTRLPPVSFPHPQRTAAALKAHGPEPLRR